MSRAEAFHAWAAGFGVPAFAASSVPTDASMPYLTYSTSFAPFGRESSATLNVWGRTSEAEVGDIAENICAELGLGGTTVSTDGGAIWIKQGSPAVQSVSDPDPTIKRRLINLSIETF